MQLLTQYSMFSSTATPLVLSVIFLFLSHQSGKLYMLQWGLCWSIYSLMLLLDFGTLQGGINAGIYLALRQALSLVAAYLFLLGTHHFFQVKPSRNILLATAAFFVLTCFYPFVPVIYDATVILNVIFCSGLLISAGCMFISYSWTQNLPEKIMASFLIILWAIFINHFGFSLEYVKIAVFTHFGSLFTVVLLILLLIIIHFKKSKFLDSRQASRFRLLVENSSDSMFLYSYKSRSFEYVSPMISTLIGVSAKQLYDMPERFFDHLETITKNYSILNLFSKPSDKPAGGILCLMKDGQIIKWSEIHGMPILDSMENVIAVEGILRDITERKQFEEQLRAAEQEKETLLENISHEIRTPVTLIQGYTESLLNNIVPVESRDMYLKMISTKATMLTNLLEDLVQISHFSSQSLEYKFYEMPAESFWADVLVQCQFQVEQSGHVFQKEYLISDSPILIMDPYRINQVVSNLIGNAIRHTPYGGTISASCRTFANETPASAHMGMPDDTTIPDGEIIFTISDTGNGIAANDIPHIFERKFRGKNKVIHNESGKNEGLGLYISMQIITQHSGRMWAKNNPAGGAELSFAIPYYR